MKTDGIKLKRKQIRRASTRALGKPACFRQLVDSLIFQTTRYELLSSNRVDTRRHLIYNPSTSHRYEWAEVSLYRDIEPAEGAAGERCGSAGRREG